MATGNRDNPGAYAYTQDEAVNINLGQCGSMFIEYDGSADHANTPPDGLYFIAITVVNDCKFETLTQADSSVCFGTGGGSSSNTGPPGDLVLNTDVFPSGLTFFGRWTTIKMDQGRVIAYLGQ